MLVVFLIIGVLILSIVFDLISFTFTFGIAIIVFAVLYSLPLLLKETPLGHIVRMLYSNMLLAFAWAGTVWYIETTFIFKDLTEKNVGFVAVMIFAVVLNKYNKKEALKTK